MGREIVVLRSVELSLMAASLALLIVSCIPGAARVPPTVAPLLVPSLPASTPGTTPSPTSRPITPAALPSPYPDGIYASSYYKLKFQAGHYTMLTEFDQEWAQGLFSVNGNRITFTELDFGPECGPEDEPFGYRFSFDGQALSFSSPDDKCLSRSDLMDATPWVYKGQ